MTLDKIPELLAVMNDPAEARSLLSLEGNAKKRRTEILCTRETNAGYGMVYDVDRREFEIQCWSCRF